MKKFMLTLVIAVTLFAGSVALGQSKETAGHISNVIVYRGQALVTRTIDVDLPEGTSELAVTGLPDKIVSESLYSQGPANIKILSVRYREKAVREDTRKEVKEVDAQIEKVSRDLKHAEDQRLHYGIIWEKYDPFWKLTADTAKSDLNRGLLQFEPIEKLTGHLEGKLNELYEKRVTLADNIEDLKKDLELLKRKRSKLAAGRSHTQREAVVFLNKTDSKSAVIELSYLVNGANWTPQYNLRAKPDKSSTLIEYNAVVHQASGENWNDTKIALSTAEPSLVSGAPMLDPMEIALREIAPGHVRRRGQNIPMSNMMQAEDSEQRAQIGYLDQSQQFRSLVSSRSSNSKKGVKAQALLNSIALGQQMLELKADRDYLNFVNYEIAKKRRTEGVSVMYAMPGKLSLPSRSDQQLLTIATVNAKSDFTLVATPLLTDYVYLQGEILNDSDIIFLPGPASTYRNGEFVGKANLELVTIGQKFIAGFGIDSQIRVAREFKDKKTDTLWGNRVDEQRYVIRIDNFKNKQVNLRLLERLPFTDNPNIEITLLDPSLSLSKDAEYLRTQKDKGILRWDLNLRAATAGYKATVVKYGYTMKYDNDMEISTVAKAQ
jgi:hypothetical protein